ncbi:hypothetical protein EVAR_14514_1 [Eumeta japonica]|uniref:Uncharacterized protein n=1 Tax=Eumeta variegata TaxID=151549 RepID=A0A4C1U3F2_EUMVA|nr:hypothetical protein EVAR_14514_1 [Eumeta japonica]
MVWDDALELKRKGRYETHLRLYDLVNTRSSWAQIAHKMTGRISLAQAAGAWVVRAPGDTGEAVGNKQRRTRRADIQTATDIWFAAMVDRNRRAEGTRRHGLRDLQQLTAGTCAPTEGATDYGFYSNGEQQHVRLDQAAQPGRLGSNDR